MNNPSMYQLAYIVSWFESTLEDDFITTPEQTRTEYNVTRYHFTPTQLDRMCELVNNMIPAFYPNCNLNIYHVISTKTGDDILIIAEK